MKDEALTQVLARVLLVLRITLGVFLLQWGAEKFVVPQNTVAIWGYFYGLNVSQTLGYVFGYGDGPSVERGDPWLRDQGAGILSGAPHCRLRGTTDAQ